MSFRKKISKKGESLGHTGASCCIADGKLFNLFHNLLLLKMLLKIHSVLQRPHFGDYEEDQGFLCAGISVALE